MYLDGLFEHLGHDGKLHIEYDKVVPMPKKKGPNGVKRRVVDEFSKRIIDLTPCGVLEEVLCGVGDGLNSIAEGSA